MEREALHRHSIGCIHSYNRRSLSPMHQFLPNSVNAVAHIKLSRAVVKRSTSLQYQANEHCCAAYKLQLQAHAADKQGWAYDDTISGSTISAGYIKEVKWYIAMLGDTGDEKIEESRMYRHDVASIDAHGQPSVRPALWPAQRNLSWTLSIAHRRYFQSTSFDGDDA
jgi:hypothetical protein